MDKVEDLSVDQTRWLYGNGLGMLDQLEVGWVSKPHSLNGDVLVKPISNVPGRFESGARLAAQKGGRSFELEISSSKPYKDRLIVHFVGVDSREAAEAIQGATLFGDATSYDEDELLIHELIGSKVIDGEDIDRGVVASIEDNPASDLMVLEDGKLVPLIFVREFRREEGIIVVDVPSGLFDI